MIKTSLKRDFFFHDNFIVFSIFFLIMLYNVNYLNSTDLSAHAWFVDIYLETGSIPFPPVFYLTVALLSKLIPDPNAVKISLALLLSASIVWKFQLAKNYLNCNENSIDRSPILSYLIAIGLLFFMPVYIPYIDGERWYLGKFPATVWHNSTTIFVIPFCVLLFLSAIKWLKSPSKNYWLEMLGYGLLIALIKPSFLFPFIPSFLLAILILDRKILKRFWLGLLLIFIFILLLGSQTLILYTSLLDSDLFQNYTEGTKIIFAPLRVWRIFSFNHISSILTSLGFPLISIWVYRNDLKKDINFLLVFLLGVFSVLIFLTLAEDGERLYHANFLWQIPMTYFIFNLVIMNKLLLDIQEKAGFKKLPNSKKILTFLFFVHAVFGVLYLIKYFVNDTFH